MRDYGDESSYESPGTDVLLGHPNLSNEINRSIAQSAIEGGARPSKLGTDKKGYTVITQNRTYELLRTATGWTIAGHPRYCPTPTQCNIHGSTWGGSMLKMDFIGRGMHLEVGLAPQNGASGTRVMTTSPIVDVEEI
jgi:hypothetical protein